MDANKKKLITRTRVEGLVILLMAIGYIWEAHNVPSLYKLPGVPGPTVFPLLLGIVFGMSGLWLIISPEKLRGRKSKGEGEGDEAGQKKEVSSPSSKVSHRDKIESASHLGTMWVVLLGYLVLMPSLGFLVPTAVLLGTFFFLLGEKRWYKGIGLALVVTVLVYLGFAQGLGIRLPLGILAPLLK